MSGAFDKLKFILVNEKFLESFVHANMHSNISHLNTLHKISKKLVSPSKNCTNPPFLKSLKASFTFYWDSYKKGKLNAPTLKVLEDGKTTEIS